MARNDKPDALEAQSIVVAAILAHLLKNGIAESSISSVDFSEAFVEAGVLSDNDQEELFDALLKWLDRERLIHVGNSLGGTRGENYYACSLTSQGLAALRSPSPLLDGETPGEVIKKTSSRDASVAPHMKAGSFLGSLFGGMIKSLSG